MRVPFVDLKEQYRGLQAEMDAALRSVIEETAFVRGRFVSAFEAAYARAYGVKHCVSCANGTDAIYITLKMLGLGPGDEVITTACSWISTSEAISQTGARPVFVDIEPDYFTIDAARIEAKITPRTRAVLPVHLYGQPAEVDAIRRVCDARGLRLVEDCAQAHFATCRGKRVGTFGDAGTFSFYPGKNLGAYGDAGAIVTDDDDLAVKVRMYANHGSLRKHDHEIEGINSRLDGLQAAVLSVKLPHVEAWNARRREIAGLYGELLRGCPGIELPRTRPEATHVFHLYVIRTPRRDELQRHLKERGVETAVHYPTALPFLKAYAAFGHRPEDFPVAHRCQQEILSLPMYPELTPEMVAYVAAAITAWAGGRG